MLRVFTMISGHVVWLEGAPGQAWSTALAALGELELRRARELAGGSKALSWAAHQPDVYVLAQERVNESTVVELRLRSAALKIYVIESKSPSHQREDVLLDAGADGCSFVPVPVSTLNARVRALLRVRGGAFGQRCPAELSLDAERQELLLPNGRRVRLSPAEFKLAEFLAARRGGWVRREDVFFEVFNAAPRYESSLLRTHVYNLRRKLGTNRWLLRSDRSKGVMLAQPVDSEQGEA